MKKSTGERLVKRLAQLTTRRQAICAGILAADSLTRRKRLREVQDEINTLTRRTT